MSRPSSWPLPPNSSRFVLPRNLLHQLTEHPLTRDLYPLGIGHYRRAQGHQMMRDRHDDYLLIYCIDGLGALHYAEQTFTLSAGTLVLLPKGLPHQYHADASNPWTIYWVHFEGDQAQAFSDNTGLSRQEPVLNIGLQPRLINDFEQLLQVRQSGYQLRPFIHAANQLRQILSSLALIRPYNTSRGSLDIEQVHALMQTHIHEQLDLETLARSVNLSKFHFAKKYRELTGSTAINHFINLKIEHACQLLDIGQQSISEISYALGYEDTYYFSRLFKKVMGIAPTQYRKLRLGSWPNRSL